MLTPERIAELLTPYIGSGSEDRTGLCVGLATYLELLLKWNARTNLTAIREPEEIVRRHFGESLFVARHLGDCESVLDFGSGAGFPGIPIQLARPELRVTLAESQGKKASFLREAVRELGLNTEVWAGRVEAMPSGRRFDVVTLRAVDSMDRALVESGKRAMCRIAVIGTSELVAQLGRALPALSIAEPVLVPGLRGTRLFVASHLGAE